MSTTPTVAEIRDSLHEPGALAQDPVEALRACLAADGVNLERARSWIGTVWNERAGLRRRIAELEHHLAGVGEPQDDVLPATPMLPALRAAMRVLTEIEQRRDTGNAPVMKARLDLGIGRDLERTVRVRVEVDGGYTGDDLAVVAGIADKYGADIGLQNAALELYFGVGSINPAREVRVEWEGQVVVVAVAYPDGVTKSVGNLAYEAAEQVGARQEPPQAFTLHGKADPDGIRILDGALSAARLTPGETYQLVCSRAL